MRAHDSLMPSSPAPRHKPLGPLWCWSHQMGLSDYIAWRHTQIILADAIGFPLLFGNCFSLSRKCGECFSESVNIELHLVVNTYLWRVSSVRHRYMCQMVGNAPEKTEAGKRVREWRRCCSFK